MLEPYFEQYLTFFLCVERNDISCLSIKDSARFLVGDSLGSTASRRLALCVVSADMECDHDSNTTECVLENVEYRIRVTAPIKGYLHLVDSFVEVAPSFQKASGFFLKANGTGPYMALGGSYLHIMDKRPVVGQARSLLTNQGSGFPLVFDHVLKGDGSQDFFTLYLTP